MVSMRRISLERRRGNLSDVEKFYKDYIESAASPEIASFFSIKFARFLLKVRSMYLNSPILAVTIFNTADFCFV